MNNRAQARGSLEIRLWSAILEPIPVRPGMGGV